MRIDVIGSATMVTEESVKGRVAVVIDVLRATSVMVSALVNGAKQVIPVVSPEEAFALKEKLGSEVILGGERDALPIAGFDYGNSPLQYTEEVVEGKTIVMTTTNGTLAINNAAAADQLIIASFLNAEAVLQFIEEKEDIALICSGTDGQFTLEDALCAGYLIEQLHRQNNNLYLSDMAVAIHQLYKANQQDMISIASQGKHYQNLLRKGFVKDLEYCFQIGVLNNVPIRVGGVIKNTTC